MNFNNFFEETAGNSQSTQRKQLEGNKIHEVTFDGVEARDFTTQAGKDFHVLEIKFSNDEGYFIDTIWEPTEEDTKDRESSFGPQPNNFLCLQYKIKHLIDAVNSELSTKIDNGEFSLSANSWDGFRNKLVEALSSSKGVKTKIKLNKDNKGYPIFPRYFLSYTRDTIDLAKKRVRMTTNFIGNGVFFTQNELNKIQKQETAKPVSANDLDTVLTPTEKQENSDFDLDF